MRSLAIAALVAAQLAAAMPAQAADLDGRGVFLEDRRGGFAGVRIRARSGGPDQGVRAALTLAPTVHNRIGAASRMEMGEGLELGVSPGARPTLTLAGQRLDRMSLFGEEVPERQNMSTVAKVAIVAGVIVVVGAVAFGHILSNASCFHGPRDCS